MIKFPAICSPTLKNALSITEIHSEKTGTHKNSPVLFETTQNSNRKRVIFMPKYAILINSEQSRAEQSRAEQSRAEQSRAEQSRAEQSRAEQLMLKISASDKLSG